MIKVSGNRDYYTNGANKDARCASGGSSDARDETPAPPSRPLVGRLLVVHANGKTYGTGGDSALTDDGERVKAAKRSNREDFDFTARDYCAMRDGGVYSGDPRKNKLLPLPRPTYTEFINRAKRARCLDRLDFVYCPADAPRLPALGRFSPLKKGDDERPSESQRPEVPDTISV